MVYEEEETMRKTALLVAMSLVFAMGGPAIAAELPPGGTFFDDDGNTHEGNIEVIAAEGITRGCNPPQNTEYCPDDEVNRGAMAAFLKRALNLPPSNTDFFVDDNGSTFEADINAVAAAGVTKGCNPPANDRYCPADPVTRGAMAAFIVRAFGYTDNGGGDLFVDDDGSTFENDIDKLATAGVTKGCNPPINDRYCPNDNVKRDQMASFLTRALGMPATVPPARTDTLLGVDLNFIAIAESQGCTAFQGDPHEGVVAECQATASISSGEQFWVLHGWFEDEWSTTSARYREEFLSDGTRFDLSINGYELDLFELFYIDEDVAYKDFTFQFPGNLTQTTHTLVGEWLWHGTTDTRVILNLTITP